MTEERIAKLESIGFEWSLASSLDWDRRFNELKQYKADYGGCSVPKEWSGNKQLGRWVSKQRVQYRYLQQGKESSMTEERIAKLESIGFEWSLRG